MLYAQKRIIRFTMKSGFLLITFLVYLGLYSFLCVFILYFCSFFIQLTHTVQNKSRALYAYHSIQKRFMDDCFKSITIEVDDNKIVIIAEDETITWKMHKNSLIRKEFLHKQQNNAKAILYFCMIADHFKPFLHEKRASCLSVGFSINLFYYPFTIVAVVQKGKNNESF